MTAARQPARTPAGVSSGGQFAREPRSEVTDLTLTPHASPDDRLDWQPSDTLAASELLPGSPVRDYGSIWSDGDRSRLRVSYQPDSRTLYVADDTAGQAALICRHVDESTVRAACVDAVADGGWPRLTELVNSIQRPDLASLHDGGGSVVPGSAVDADLDNGWRSSVWVEEFDVQTESRSQDGPACYDPYYRMHLVVRDRSGQVVEHLANYVSDDPDDEMFDAMRGDLGDYASELARSGGGHG